jgi:predicted transcriptional regulator
MPRRKLPELSTGQLEIMTLVWEHSEITVAEVWEHLSAQRKISRNTVQTTMTRLEEKGWLKHRTVGKTFWYCAAQPKTAALQGLVTKLVETAFGGSAENLVMALLQGRGVSSAEARRIRGLVDAARKGGGKAS